MMEKELGKEVLVQKRNQDLKKTKEKTKLAEEKPKLKLKLVKKIDSETAKILSQLAEKINRKTYGRKIRESEIISIAVSLVGLEQIKLLQERSLSEHDRLQMAHENYQKEVARISMDEFIGKLLRGEAVPNQATI